MPIINKPYPPIFIFILSNLLTQGKLSRQSLFIANLISYKANDGIYFYIKLIY